MSYSRVNDAGENRSAISRRVLPSSAGLQCRNLTQLLRIIYHRFSQFSLLSNPPEKMEKRSA